MIALLMMCNIYLQKGQVVQFACVVEIGIDLGPYDIVDGHVTWSDVGDQTQCDV